jgi:four helix bundle protein
MFRRVALEGSASAWRLVTFVRVATPARALPVSRDVDEATVRHLEDRTRAFAAAAIRLRRLLKERQEFWDLAGQLTRAACSVAANQRAMSRARSTREFAAKLHIVHEEADEAAHWLLLLRDCNGDPSVTAAIETLHEEAIQLRNIFGHARATTRRRYFSP